MGEDDAEDVGHFPVGSVVEVLVKEAGLGGVYFTATVVTPPTETGPKNQGKLYVKYKNLLARKGCLDRLREFVDISIVRPAPPPWHKAGKRFELNDVVEAFHNDGWWEGVVCSVVDGGKRFVVTFENPPDEIEFGLSKLRAHWDWIDGVWAWPQRMGENGNLAFEVGEKVEVSIERDDDFKGGWFPAAIVRNLGNGVYLVELKDKKGGRVEEEVDCVHMRPCPPNLGDGKFGILEKADVFLDFGWWTGLIKKKVKKNDYIVFVEHTNLNIQLNGLQLRPHMEWKDGKWLIGGGEEAAPPPPSPLTPNSKSRRDVSLSDSGVPLKKLKPQIEHANQETEHIVEDEDDVSKQREDVQPSPVDCSSKLQSIDEIDQEGRSERNEDIQKLPFVKRNAIWKSIEAMEALQRMPQKPHFDPLRRINEREREGMAIGCMVNFSNVVEASHGLKFSDPKSIVDELHGMLLGLEEHGFQFGVVRQRVMKLVKAKEEEERLVDRALGIKEEINEQRGMREKIEGRMHKMNEHIGRLKEQLEISEMEKAKKVEEIANLEAGLEEIGLEMESLRSGFEI